jgi:hypothetical protein
MSAIFDNLIAGERTKGPTTIGNLNPCNVIDVIGRSAQASLDQLNDAVTAVELCTRVESADVRTAAPG